MPSCRSAFGRVLAARPSLPSGLGAFLLAALVACCGVEPSSGPGSPGQPRPSSAADTESGHRAAPAATGGYFETLGRFGELSHRRLTFAAMGTDVTIEALGPTAAGLDVLDAALSAAEAELRRVEDLCTSWRDSPLTRLNARAGQGPGPIDPELAELIGRGLAVGELSGGAFDVTFAGVGRLWDFQADPPVLPSEDEVTSALAVVDFRRVELDLDAGTLALPRDAALGLGGIAKGYGVDRAMAVLLEHGIEHGLVNAGGDLKVLGTKNGEPWRVAVRHPRDRESVLAVVPLSNTCIVTSGDYERFFEHDGRRYHHILDPRTGYPSTGAMSATVVAPDAAFADALATALSVLGPEEGLAIAEGLERVEALIVDLDGAVHRTSGLEAHR